MKRIHIIQIIGTGLFIVYITLLFIDVLTGFLQDLKILVFSAILAVISLNLIAKGVIIKSSSTLWFAINLILYAIILILFETMGIDPIKFYFVFALIPIIASVINIIVFQNLIYIKVIILNISIILPMLMQYYNILSNIWLAITYIGSLIMGILVCRLISFRREKV